MKKITTFLSLLCAAVFAQNSAIIVDSAQLENIPWLSYGEALDEAKEDKKIVLIEFYAKWCIPCHEMEKTVFRDPEVLSELKSNFHFVKLDIEKKDTILCEGERLLTPTCVRNWELGGVPAFAVVGREKGDIRHLSIGDYKKRPFLRFLNAIKSKEQGKN
ncbi:hypothetical protein AGMMS49938_08930 [Fibrobacterales bacterium]|nr:hypothetical protein AGMMS49938_08930 [Fibrobacterales bacterium]